MVARTKPEYRCRIFSYMRGGNPCCFYCKRKCEDPCLNHPERCRKIQDAQVEG